MTSKTKDLDDSIDPSTDGDEPFQKQKEKLYLMALESHFFTRKLRSYRESCNKVDKNFASLLLDVVNEISEFLDDAVVQEVDDKGNVFDIIPAIEGEVLQAHRNFQCRACCQQVRASPKAFNAHFFGNKHLKMLREFEHSCSTSAKQGQQDSHSLNGEVLGMKGAKPRRSRSKPKKPEDKLPPQATEFLLRQDLDGFTVALLQEGLTLMNSHFTNSICVLICQRLKSRFPQVKCYPFGSMVIGLGRPKGDLDIFVDVGNNYCKKPLKGVMKDTIYRTIRCLLPNSDEWGESEAIIHARTPILRIFCRAFQIDCDLSFSNGLSHRNTALIRYFIDLQPVCKKLIAFVKFWAQSLELGTNSYIVSLMVIFFLQQQQVLPSVQYLQSMVPPIIIDGWNANFGELYHPAQPATNFYKFLHGFFEYYVQFDYESSIVCVLTGTPVPKALFDHGNEASLPSQFERFAAYMSTINPKEADEVEDLFANNKPLVIQDPFELCHNVAKGIQPNKLKKIINYMRDTLVHLKQRQGSFVI